MLTVSDGIFSRTISAQRIVKVTQAAHHAAVAGSDPQPGQQGDPRYMGPLDWFTDHVFCSGIKTAVLARFYEIGRKTALLKTEMQKTDVEKNPQQISDYQQQIRRAQHQLNKVIYGKSVGINYAGLAAPTESGFLIIRNRSDRLPTGIGLCRPPDNPPQSDDLFICATPESIQAADLLKIQAAGTFRCAGQSLFVRFISNNEPIVFSRTGTPAPSIQKKLTGLWFNNAVHDMLDRLNSTAAIDPTLHLHPLFLDRGSDEDGAFEKELLNLEWNRFTQFIQTQFNDSVERMCAQVNNPFATELAELSRLSLIEHPGIEERRKLKASRVRLNEQVLRLERLHKNITRLKCELKNLSHLITFSIEPQMRAIFRQRIINFQERISEFSLSAMGQNDVSTLNYILEKQQVFLRDFGPEKIAQCYRLMAPEDTPATLAHGIVPPVGRDYQKSLINLLIDPVKPLSEVLAAMEDLGNKNQRLCQIKISQKGLAERIEANMRLCVFSETGALYRSGLDPDFGRSFYTPATYARIVTLLKMRHDLLNPRKNFRTRQLKDMRLAILEHLRHIIAEDEQIIQTEHRDFDLSRPKLHPPETLDDGTPVRHEYWAHHLKSAAFRSKIKQIKKCLAEARAANDTAIAQLQKRAKAMERLSEKSAFLSDRTLAYNEEMTKLRESLA